MLKILLLALPLAWSQPDTAKTPSEPAKPAAPAAKSAAKPAAPKAAASAELATDDQKVLYLLGASLASRGSQLDLKPGELKYVKMGLDDLLLGKQLKVNPQEINPKLQQFAQTRESTHQAAEQKKALAQSGPEKEKGKGYAAKAAKEPGAQTLPDGLVMIPIKEGTGASPKATDKVKVHYTGTLTTGQVFDSSVQRGQPAEFPLNQVIPCWTEAVQKMKVGGKVKLVCPSSIAYGDQGRPPQIPGGATLVFEVELLEIVK